MALLKVNESAQVLFLKPSTNSDFPWIVLCYDPTVKDKWVVWQADDGGNTVHGNYKSTFEEAKAVFDSLPEGKPAISN